MTLSAAPGEKTVYISFSDYKKPHKLGLFSKLFKATVFP